MNKVLLSIESNFMKMVKEYNLVVSEKYDIDIHELEECWMKFNGNDTPVSKGKSKTQPSSPDVAVANKCIYKFIKGQKQGEFCNKNTKNSNYCSLHNKFETSVQKEKKAKIPPVSDSSRSPNRVIRLNKDLNKWWHQESKLVFKSNKEKLVIGTYKNDEYKLLSNDDINDCEKYGFKYEITKKEEDDEKENEDEKKGESEDEDEKKDDEKKAESEDDEKGEEEIKPLLKRNNKKQIIPRKIEKKNINEEIKITNLNAKNVEDLISEMIQNSDDSEDELDEEE